jgi:outer membrane protein assembly factor BamB
VDAGTGRRAWSVDTKLPFSAGPGYGEGLVVVCSSDGDVLAFDAADGTERWRAQAKGEVLATPTIARGRVLIRTVDGTLRSLSAADGAEEWVIEREVPRLTLRGNAPPVVFADLVISGFDNGKVSALSLQTGETLWEISLAPPSGRTELERMVDVDSRIWIVGEDLFVSGYHGRTVSLASESGQILWSRDIDSYAGVGVDWNSVYVTQSDSAVLAMARRGGAAEWSQEGLKFRTATAPVPYGKSVVVGDFEGYVHWLDAASGEFVARERAGEAIVMPPLVVGELLVVFSEDGQLTAYRADFGSG